MSARAGAGDLALVLHSHMPYVEGFGTYPFGEEWLFDAILRSYVPVCGVADRLTMTVTPVLADQLEADGVNERLLEFCRRFRIGSADDDARDVEVELKPACEAEAERYRVALARLEALDGDLLELFAEPARAGRIELLASNATHAVLPMLATRQGRNLQLDAGLRSHRRRFGEVRGLWLPECAYEPGLERLLAAHGIDYFCTDQSAHETATAALAPVAAGAGTTAFTIDWEAVQWLWSLDGYPSDPRFADFHRKSLRGTRPWAIGEGAYDPQAGEDRARELGREFVAAAAGRLRAFATDHGRRGLMVFAIDTELLGHWWWEGPAWLDEVVSTAGEHGVELVTLREAAQLHEGEDRELRSSTWGEHKNLSTWDSPAVADMAWAARRFELRVLRAAFAGLPAASLERAVRELLAVQASDWAFLDRRGQAGDYAWQRSTDHGEALLRAVNSRAGLGLEPRLRGLAPDLSVAPLFAT
jgi:1,4-alpha-glucan branching enzyme